MTSFGTKHFITGWPNLFKLTHYKKKIIRYQKAWIAGEVAAVWVGIEGGCSRMLLCAVSACTLISLSLLLPFFLWDTFLQPRSWKLVCAKHGIFVPVAFLINLFSHKFNIGLGIRNYAKVQEWDRLHYFSPYKSLMLMIYSRLSPHTLLISFFIYAMANGSSNQYFRTNQSL